MLKAVLDTQIILRGATSARPTITAKIYEAWDAGRFTLLLSEPILEEIEDVMSRPEVRRRLRTTAVEASALIELLRRRSVFVTPTVRVARSRDADDDKFLECAVTENADYVVSADADLLSLREVQGIPIVASDAFMSSTACLVGSSTASRRRRTVMGRITSRYLPRT